MHFPRRCAPRFLAFIASLRAVRATNWGGHALTHSAASRHANMKELRFSAADGEWASSPSRFDPKTQSDSAGSRRQNSGGKRKKRFFTAKLIRKADNRFDAHVARLKKEGS